MKIDKDFSIFSDKELTVLTPYNVKNRYVKTVFPRIHRAYKQIIKRIPKGARVLEIGASPFYLSYLLAKYHAAEVDAVFYSNDDHILRDSDKCYFNGGKINLFHTDIEKNCNDFNSDYDLIVSMECLEHLDNFPFGFYEKIVEILKPSGYVYITVPNVNSISNIIKLILGKNIYHSYRVDPTGRHKYEFTKHDLVNIFKYCLGFEIFKLRSFSDTNSFKSRFFFGIWRLVDILKRYQPHWELIAKKSLTAKSPDWVTLSRTLYKDDLSLEE